MDVLAICGSPRKKGTTISVLEPVLAGTGRSYEILWPAFMKIGHCIGCQKCHYETPGRCWQDDDMTMAIEKMLEAKALIIASPTYFGNVPGPLKNFIDRSVPTCHTGKGEAWAGAEGHGTRPFKGQPAMIVVVSGGGDHEKTAANIRLVLNYYAYQVGGEFVEGMGGVIVTKEEYPDIYNELFALGRKLDEALKTKGV
jgi:multimeric flavodoxin WrbA